VFNHENKIIENAEKLDSFLHILSRSFSPIVIYVFIFFYQISNRCARFPSST